MKERLALLFISLALPIFVSAATFTRPLTGGSSGSDVSALHVLHEAVDEEERPLGVACHQGVVGQFVECGALVLGAGISLF